MQFLLLTRQRDKVQLRKYWQLQKQKAKQNKNKQTNKQKNNNNPTTNNQKWYKDYSLSWLLQAIL